MPDHLLLKQAGYYENVSDELVWDSHCYYTNCDQIIHYIVRFKLGVAAVDPKTGHCVRNESEGQSL